MSRRRLKISACLLVLLAVPSATLAADSHSLTVDGSRSNPSIPGIRATASPSIDGMVDEPCWTAAPVISGFTRETKPPRFETEVRVLYDDHAMYFAFRCNDPEPGRISAQQKKRNGSFDSDDTVEICIDPRDDRQSVYIFLVNAAGTQAEEIPGGSATKVEWRGDWQAAAKVTADGWTAEMAVPFGILRYPRGQKTFGLTFSRYIARHLEWSNWPVGTKPWLLENEARWQDIQAPRIVRKPRVMPYVMGGSGAFESSTGLDLKYTTENEVTSLLTLHPDFQTVEESVQTVDFSYNQRYIEDRRPFFTEGADLFDSAFGFYSTRVGEVDAGAKSFGTVGPWTFAGLAATRQHEETDAVGLLRYAPSTTWNVWMGGMAHRLSAPGAASTLRNAVTQFGGSYWKPMEVGGVGAQVEVANSRTTGEGGHGEAVYAGVWREAPEGQLTVSMDYTGISPDYDARLSYMPQIGIRKLSGRLRSEWPVQAGSVRRVSTRLVWDWTDRWDGGLYHRGVLVRTGLSFRNDTGISLQWEAGTQINERVVLLPGEGEPIYNAERVFDDRLTTAVYSWRETDLYNSGGVCARMGRLAGGPYRYLEAWQGVRISEAASASVSGSTVRLDGDVDDIDTWRVIASGLYEFSSERSIAVRGIIGHQREGTEKTRLHNAFLAYRQELRRGADIFVLIGDPNTNGVHTDVAMKYVVAY